MMFLKMKDHLKNLKAINVKFDKKINIYLNEQIVEVGFTSSKSEARKLIKNSGVKINRVLVSDELKMLSINDFDNNKELLVSVGKKKHFIIKKLLLLLLLLFKKSIVL